MKHTALREVLCFIIEALSHLEQSMFLWQLLLQGMALGEAVQASYVECCAVCAISAKTPTLPRQPR